MREELKSGGENAGYADVQGKVIPGQKTNKEEQLRGPCVGAQPTTRGTSRGTRKSSAAGVGSKEKA